MFFTGAVLLIIGMGMFQLGAEISMEPIGEGIGVGLSMVRTDKDSSSDSFGLVALSSIGPILAVMMLGLFYRPEEARKMQL